MKIDEREIILQYEKELFTYDFCCLHKNLDKRIDNNFMEIGASGVQFNKEVVIDELSKLKCDRKIAILNFSIEKISENIILARYIAHFLDKNKKSFRSSIWKYVNEDWKLFYHQGTNCKE